MNPVSYDIGLSRKQFAVLLSIFLLLMPGAVTWAGEFALPKRGADRVTGSFLSKQMEDMNSTAAQELMVREVLSGNVPDYMRVLRPVCWDVVTSGANGTSESHEICLDVLPDYVAVGSNEDYLRVPLMPHFAQQMADGLHCVLPTRLMVNRVYEMADVKVEPRPFSPREYEISSPTVWMMSSRAIDEQLMDRRGKGLVIGGIKKDVIVTRQLGEPARSPRVAIYGWHKLDGLPIQPVTLVHAATYVDYSHGIRLISKTMRVDGKSTDVLSVLSNPSTADWLSDEGPLDSGCARYPVSRSLD